LWWEQWHLRTFLRKHGVDVLVALGNFALLNSPVPQLLLNRNALYFSPQFSADLWRRRCYRDWLVHKLKSQLARLSIRQAHCNVTPTAAFAQQIQAAGFAQAKFEIVPFGFDAATFTANPAPLSPALAAKLKPDCLRVLYVSHYNYFRNFETLLRAWPLVKEQVRARTGKAAQLVLTTEIKRGAVYGGYDATAAAALIEQLDIASDIAMLGSVPYDQLHQLYRACDLFVCPSYAESFGHPLVEAMASGLPVVAADLPVHREVCGAAASYFDVFDETALAVQCVRVLSEVGLQAQLREHGLQRSREFSWERHCQQLLALIERCAKQPV
jgi:glycosyltransferase involved in cell wall biosynthesis